MFWSIVELKSVDREKKLKRKDFLEEIRRASNEEYVTEWDNEGRIGVQKKKTNIKRGSKSKSAGGLFELRVRKDLEKKGWIVDKWSNNVELKLRQLIPAKKKFNPFNKVISIGTGFPDFIALQSLGNKKYSVIGVEVKMNGRLSRIEKEKCIWLLEQEIFSQILIASKVKVRNRVRIVYINVHKIIKKMKM